MRSRPNWAAGALAAVWLVIVGVPIYTMISWSLQTREDFLDRGPIALPASLTLENLFEVLNSGFGRYLVNTLVVTVACVGLTLLVAVPAAYAIVRSTSRLAGTAFRIFLLGLAIPAQATIIPLFLIINRMQLYDSLTAIILPTVAFGLPLVILVLAGSLRDVSIRAVRRDDRGRRRSVPDSVAAGHPAVEGQHRRGLHLHRARCVEPVPVPADSDAGPASSGC